MLYAYEPQGWGLDARLTTSLAKKIYCCEIQRSENWMGLNSDKSDRILQGRPRLERGSFANNYDIHMESNYLIKR
jgi:hypothetical protein